MSGLLHLFKLPPETKSIPLEVAKEVIENNASTRFPLPKQPKQPFRINNRKPFNAGLAGKKKNV